MGTNRRQTDPLEIKPRVHWTILLLLSVFLAPATRAQWTQYGGPSQDFSIEDQGIAEEWPNNGLRTIWSRKLGEGYSAILAEADRLYTMYRDGKNEVVISLDAKTGKTLWEYKYESTPLEGIDANYGTGPNATPLLTDGLLYTISIAGVMHCLDAETGSLLWSHNLWTGYKGEVTAFGYSSSPIHYKNNVIVFMGGDGQSMAAFDRKDGHIVWKGLTFPLSYGTPKLMTLCGQDQLVVCTADAVIGVDPNTGKMLWRYPVENRERQNITMPTRLDDDELFFSTYEMGSRRLKIVKNGEFRVEEIWSSRHPQFMITSFVRLDDHVYGSSGDQTSSFMAAVNVHTGKLAWRTRDFELANVVGIGRHLIILDQKGYLGLATPSAEGVGLQSKIKPVEQWSRTAPTVVGKVLYVRDMRNIMALDLG